MLTRRSLLAVPPLALAAPAIAQGAWPNRSIRMISPFPPGGAADLIASGDIGTLRANVRRFFSRGFKSYVSRRGYREGGWGVLLALCTGAFPLLSYLKAALEPDRHR